MQSLFDSAAFHARSNLQSAARRLGQPHGVLLSMHPFFTEGGNPAATMACCTASTLKLRSGGNPAA